MASAQDSTASSNNASAAAPGLNGAPETGAVRPVLICFPKQEHIDDCYRAAVATVLELPIEDVPHFYREAGARWPDQLCVPGVYDRIRSWCAERGLAPLFLVFSAPLVEILHHTNRLNPGVPFILGGLSAHGTGHAVIACNGRIAHDPGKGPTENSIVAPLPNGNFEVTYFVVLPTWANPKRAAVP